jgi:hypothetical protein
VDTLLIDQEMVYTPRQSNDRLLLQEVSGQGSLGDRKFRAEGFGKDEVTPCLVTVRKYGTPKVQLKSATLQSLDATGKAGYVSSNDSYSGSVSPPRSCPALHRTARSVPPQPAFREPRPRVLLVPSACYFSATRVSCTLRWTSPRVRLSLRKAP